jgi:hypothetical protein
MSICVTTTIDALYAAILGTLRGTYGARIATYAPYDPLTLLDPEAALNTPALYLEIEEQGTDAGTEPKALRERTATRLTFSLHAVLSIRTHDIQIALDVLASSLLVLIRQPDADSRLGARPGARWGLGPAVTPAESVIVLQTDWQPGLNGFGARAVRWEQTIYLPDDPLACLNEGGPTRYLGATGA